jgi:hypothetical protein
MNNDSKCCGRKAFDWSEDGHSGSQDSRSSGQNLNPGLPEYDAGVLTTRPRHLVKVIIGFEAEII